MKFEDKIKFSLLKWPSLYVSVDYETSKKLVCDYLFIIRGIWAETGNDASGGYLVSDREYYEKNGKCIFKKDKPYGIEKYNGPDIERFFAEDIVSVSKKEYNRCIPFHDAYWSGFFSEIPKDIFPYCYRLNINESKYFNISTGEELDRFNNMAYLVDSNTQRDYFKEVLSPSGYNMFWHPSNIYSLDNMNILKIDKKIIQKDWLDGILWYFSECLEYYKEICDEKINNYLKYIGNSIIKCNLETAIENEKTFIDIIPSNCVKFFDEVDFQVGLDCKINESLKFISTTSLLEKYRKMLYISFKESQESNLNYILKALGD